MHLISAKEISPLLPMSRAISLMRDAFQMISREQASLANRQSLRVGSGTGLLMGAAHDEQGTVVKLVSVMPSNLSKGLPGCIGLALLMDSETGEPLALIDGTRLTAIRTAALNACAVDLLAKPDSRVALIIGCGTQASAQLAGLQAVRELEQIRVMGRDQERADDFVRLHREQMNVELITVSNPARALDGVDIIVGATNSLEPVVPGELIPDGCHVSGMGSFKQDMCEFDTELLAKASIFVESRQTASTEAGELIKGVKSGVTRQCDWKEIGEVLLGARTGRRNPDEITFFKSVGHAVFDLFAARAIWQMAKEKGGGTIWQP